jgi:site-specific recombinase XerD
MKMSKALLEFTSYNKNKGLLDRTVQNYIAFVEMFMKYSGNVDVKNLDHKLIADYTTSLYQRNLSKATVGTYLRHLKIFISYLERKGYIKVELSKEIKQPRLPRKILTIYDDQEINIIFDEIKNRNPMLESRNKSIVCLMLDSGLRLQEVVDLKLSDIDFKYKTVNVTGKGGNMRIAPLGSFTIDCLSNYLKYHNLNNEILFLTKTMDPITRDTIKQLIQKLSYRLPFEFSAHKLRHNFATNYCLDSYRKNGSVDIYKLKILLGHTDIETTQRYLHLANQIIIAKTDISHLDKLMIS